MSDTRLLLTPEEAANRLQLNRSAIYRAISAGDLRSIKYGKLRRISVRALEEFIARQEGRDAPGISRSESA